MTGPTVDKITLQFIPTRDDYVRYCAIANRHNSDWLNLVCYFGAFPAAIPLAFFFEALGRGLAAASADAALIGKFSLFAFLLGALTMQLAGLIMRRLAIRRYVAGTLNLFKPKQIVFDTIGVTMTGELSEAHWCWAAISGVTAQRGLLLPAARDAAIAFIRARRSDAASAASTPAA